MQSRTGDSAQPSPVITLGGYAFTFEGALALARDASGAIRELTPQARYAKKDSVPLHPYGHGMFCSFRVSIAKSQAGVYALVVDTSLCYIGECADLGRRFYQYGNISPKNCYRGGRSTNCKINHWVLDTYKAGKRVDLYFHPTPQHKMVEAHLITQYAPPLNSRGK